MRSAVLPVLSSRRKAAWKGEAFALTPAGSGAGPNKQADGYAVRYTSALLALSEESDYTDVVNVIISWNSQGGVFVCFHFMSQTHRY